MIFLKSQKKVVNEAGNFFNYVGDYGKIITFHKDGLRRCSAKHGKIAINKENRAEKSKCYIEAIQKTINLVKKSAAQCNKSSRPDLCKSRYDVLERRLKSISNSFVVKKGF